MIDIKSITEEDMLIYTNMTGYKDGCTLEHFKDFLQSAVSFATKLIPHHTQYNILLVSYDEIPLYVNDNREKYKYDSKLLEWRLTIGK